MTTKRLSEMQKTRGAFGRAFAQAGQSLPAALRINWRNVVMPWRMLPQPVALALIGLVALAMVITPSEADSKGDGNGCQAAALHLRDVFKGIATDEDYRLIHRDSLQEFAIAQAELLGVCEGAQPVATIGGTAVPSTLACEEDEVIGFVGIPDTLVCIHYEQTVNADEHGCVPPAEFSEWYTHCVLPDGTLPCAVGHEEIGGACIPDGFGTPVCEPAPRNDGRPPDTHCLMKDRDRAATAATPAVAPSGAIRLPETGIAR